MTTNSGTSPLGILVLAELGRLRSAEADLAQSLTALSTDRTDRLSQWSMLSSIAEVRERTDRLDRMLEAMTGWGYEEGQAMRSAA